MSLSHVAAGLTSRDKYIASAAHRRHDGTAAATRDEFRRRLTEPEDAQARKLVQGKRIGGAGIAPIHIPSVLGEFRAHIGFLDLKFKHVPVEIFKSPLWLDYPVDILFQVDARRCR